MRRTARHIATLLIAILGLCPISTSHAQELEAKVVVNHSKIQGTNTSVFTTLQEAMTEFLREQLDVYFIEKCTLIFGKI